MRRDREGAGGPEVIDNCKELATALHNLERAIWQRKYGDLDNLHRLLEVRRLLSDAYTILITVKPADDSGIEDPGATLPLQPHKRPSK